MNMQRKIKFVVWLCAVMLVLGTIGCGDETRLEEETDVEISTSGELPDNDTADETNDEDRSEEGASSLLPESSYDMVEKAWLSLLKHEIISLNESGEFLESGKDWEYHCAYGIYGDDEMKLIDADVKIIINGDILGVSELKNSGERNAVDFLLQTALHRAGELYLEQAELDFYKTDERKPITFRLSVTEMSSDEAEPIGVIIIVTDDMIPLELMVGGRRLSHLNEYTVDISKERIFEGETEELKPILTVKAELSMSNTELWTNIDRGENAEKGEIKRLAYGRFLEGQKRYYDGRVNFPALDYDGDGNSDRVFKSEKGNVYLMLSNGQCIELGQQKTPDQGGWLELADVNEDGKSELIYIRHQWSSAGSPHAIRMWSRSVDGLLSFPFVDSSGNNSNFSMQIRIPLILEKTDDTHMKITQPECGITVVQEFTQIVIPGEPAQSDHWGFKDGERGPIDSEVDCDSIKIEKDPQTGKVTLKMYGLVGDKWSTISVGWEMIYTDGVWRVNDFYNMN